MDRSGLLQTAALSTEGPSRSEIHVPSNEPSNCPFDTISKQLDDLDREEEEFIRSINRKRLELKRLWNSALPIHRLPNELLIQLFVDCRGAIESYLCLNPGRTKPVHDGWQSLMLVCRHWRDILVSTPLFWREVSLRRQSDWIKLCLTRSSPAPIEVFAPEQTPCPISVLYPHARRFRTFFFETGCGLPLQTALPPLFSGGMPLLEYLNFAVHDHPPTTDPFDLNLTSLGFPSLQTLELSSVAIIAPRDMSLYTQLRKLSLCFCSHPFSFDEFLDVLAACTQLEQLTLSNTLHRLSGDWAHVGGPVPRRPPISLPRLRELTSIAHGPRHTSRFLAYVYLQPSIIVEISALFYAPFVDRQAPDTNTAKDIRAMLPPDRLATLPILAAATRVEMVITYGGYEIRCSHASLVGPTGFPSEAPLSSFTVNKDEPSWDVFLMNALDDLVECFGRAPLTSLKIDMVQASEVTDSWERVFLTFPRLEALDVAGEIDVAAIFLGLHGASTLGMGHPDCAVACPNLARVRVWGCGLVATYAAMLECFQCRADKGVRLDILDLEDVYDGGGLTPEARCAFVEDLRLVMGCVRVKDDRSEGDFYAFDDEAWPAGEPSDEG